MTSAGVSAAQGILFAAVATFTLAGYHVIGGFVPLYMVAVVAAAAVLVAQPSSYRIDRRFALFAGLSLLYVAWTFISAAISTPSLRPIKFAFGAAAGLLLTYVAYHALRDRESQYRFLIFFLILHTAGLLLGLFQFSTGRAFFSPSANVGIGEQPAGFEAMNYLFGKNYLPLLAFGLIGLVHGKSFRMLPRLAITLMALIGVVGVTLSQSRSTQLGAVLGVAALLTYKRNYRALLLLAPLCIALAWFGLTSAKTAALMSNETPFGDWSTTMRVLAWLVGIRMFLDHPWIGVGGGNYRIYFDEYAPTWWLKISPAGLEPHNLFLGILTGLGVLGLILFLLPAGYAVRAAVRTFRRSEHTWAGLVAGATALYLLMFLIDFNFHNYFDDNNFWVFLGLFFAALRLSHESAGPATASAGTDV